MATKITYPQLALLMDDTPVTDYTTYACVHGGLVITIEDRGINANEMGYRYVVSVNQEVRDYHYHAHEALGTVRYYTSPSFPTIISYSCTGVKSYQVVRD